MKDKLRTVYPIPLQSYQRERERGRDRKRSKESWWDTLTGHLLEA